MEKTKVQENVCILLLLHEDETIQIVRNAIPIKATAPEKRLKLSKEPETIQSNTDTSEKETESVIEKKQSLISILQSEVEEKLEKQQEANKDVMDTVIVSFIFHIDIEPVNTSIQRATATE